MYRWLWQHLPGAGWRRVLLALALAAALVAVLFAWVFPWVGSHLPYEQVTVTSGHPADP